MTPATKSALRTLGLSAGEFCTLTGTHPSTLSGWGGWRTGRSVQTEPPWVRLLLDAWTLCPEALTASQNTEPPEAAPSFPAAG